MRIVVQTAAPLGNAVTDFEVAGFARIQGIPGAMTQWPLFHCKTMLSSTIVLTFVCKKPTSEFLDFAMTAEAKSPEATAKVLSPEIEFAILKLREYFERHRSSSAQ